MHANVHPQRNADYGRPIPLGKRIGAQWKKNEVLNIQIIHLALNIK